MRKEIYIKIYNLYFIYNTRTVLWYYHIYDMMIDDTYCTVYCRVSM